MAPEQQTSKWRGVLKWTLRRGHAFLVVGLLAVTVFTARYPIGYCGNAKRWLVIVGDGVLEVSRQNWTGRGWWWVSGGWFFPTRASEDDSYRWSPSPFDDGPRKALDGWSYAWRAWPSVRKQVWTKQHSGMEETLSLPLWPILLIVLLAGRPVWRGWRADVRRLWQVRPAWAAIKGEHPPSGYCRNCSYPMDPGRCPECGTVVPKNRLRRMPRGVLARRLAVSCAGTLALLGGTALLISLARQVDWLGHLPARVLLDLQKDRIDWVAEELTRRHRAGLLDFSQGQRLFQQAFDSQVRIRGDSNPFPFPVDFAPLLRVDRAIQLHLPDAESRGGRLGELSIMLDECEVTSGDRVLYQIPGPQALVYDPIATVVAKPVSRSYWDNFGESERERRPRPLPLPFLDEGEHEITLRQVVAVYDGPERMAAIESAASCQLYVSSTSHDDYHPRFDNDLAHRVAESVYLDPLDSFFPAPPTRVSWLSPVPYPDAWSAAPIGRCEFKLPWPEDTLRDSPSGCHFTLLSHSPIALCGRLEARLNDGAFVHVAQIVVGKGGVLFSPRVFPLPLCGQAYLALAKEPSVSKKLTLRILPDLAVAVQHGQHEYFDGILEFVYDWCGNEHLGSWSQVSARVYRPDDPEIAATTVSEEAK